MDFLFKKTNSRYLAILRIIIGTWFFVDMVSMLVSGYVKTAYVTSEMNFPFYGFEWITPLPGIGMYLLFVVLALASVGITIGYQLRICLSVFLIGFTYVFMCDIVYTLNKFYLFLWFAFILLFTQADKAISFANPERKGNWVPYWNIFVFQFILGLIYTYSGISKLNPDWLFHGEPLMFFLRRKFPFKLLEPETFKYVAFAFTYCGMIFDLVIVALLTISLRTRVIGHFLQISFHLLNFIFLGIGSLSIFTLVLTLVLFPLPWVKRRLKLETTIQSKRLAVSALTKKLTIAFLVFVMGFHIALPHRGII